MVTEEVMWQSGIVGWSGVREHGIWTLVSGVVRRAGIQLGVQ